MENDRRMEDKPDRGKREWMERPKEMVDRAHKFVKTDRRNRTERVTAVTSLKKSKS